MASFLDVTSLRQAHQRIRLSEIKLHAISDSTSESNILVSSDYKVLFANKAARLMSEKIYGKQMEEGDSIFDYIRDDVRSAFDKNFNDALGGKELNVEQKLYLGQGKKIWLYINFFPVYEENHLVGVSFNAIDISSLKEAEEKIAIKKQELESILNALDDSAIVTITDLDGQIIKANDRFCEISKYSRKELLGQNHRILNSAYHTKEFWQGMWKTIKSGNTWKGEIKNKAKDGSYYWVYTINNPIIDVKGNIILYLSIRFLITDLKEAEEKIMKQNAALREIAFFQSHILRRPVANVIGLLDLIEEEREQNSMENINLYLDLLKQAISETDEVIHQIVEKVNEIE